MLPNPNSQKPTFPAALAPAAISAAKELHTQGARPFVGQFGHRTFERCARDFIQANSVAAILDAPDERDAHNGPATPRCAWPQYLNERKAGVALRF